MNSKIKTNVPENGNDTRFDPVITIPVLVLIGAACGYLMFNLERGTQIIQSVLTWCEYKLGWLYVLTIIFTFVFSVWLFFSKYGKVRLCAPGEKPAFSLFNWFSMLFFTTMAASIMVWGFIEPTFYYQNPPYGMEAFSPEAYEWSLTQTMFHWGVGSYSAYVPFAVGIAYIVHVRKRPCLRASAACEPVIGPRLANGPVGKILDIFVVFGILGGMSTSFGMAVPVVLAGFCDLTGLQPTNGVMICILIAWTLVFGTSVYLGLEKGIKNLSNINLILATVFIVGCFLLGPTMFTLKMFVSCTGQQIQNFVRMITWMDPIEGTGFVESWTIFYYAWYLGFATSVGIFVARISKGRTIREVILGCTVVIALCAAIIQAIFSSYTMNLELTGQMAVSEMLAELGDNLTVVEIVKTLPGGKFWEILHTVLLFTFVATSLDSTSFTLATMATRRISGDDEPTNRSKLMWAITLLVVTGTLSAIGGLKAIQVSSILASVPLMVIAVILAISTRKMLREDSGDAKRAKKLWTFVDVHQQEMLQVEVNEADIKPEA